MGRKRGCLLLIGLLAVMTIAIGIPQYRAYHLRKAQLSHQTKDITALLYYYRKFPLEKITVALADACRTRDRAERLIPPYSSADSEALAAEIHQMATDHGVMVTLSPPVMDRRDFYLQADLPVVLEGRSTDLQAFLQMFENHPRLVDWRRVCMAPVGDSTDRQRIIARLRVFAFSSADEKQRSLQKRAERQGPAVWLPPYAGRVAALEQNLADLERQASNLRDWPQWKQAYRDFKEAKRVLRMQIEVIKALAKESRTFDEAFLASAGHCDAETRSGAPAGETGDDSRTQ